MTVEQIEASMDALFKDPAFESARRLEVAEAERQLVALREPTASGKKYDAWEKEQSAALERDYRAFDDMIQTVPTTAQGAAAAINTFLGHSLAANAIESYPDVETFLKTIRTYLTVCTPELRQDASG